MIDPSGRSAGTPALSVLWVESSHALAERLIRLSLGRAGIAAATAATLEAAVAQLRTCTFDVVIVDVSDPSRGLDLAALGALRGAAPGATLVALTADAEPETLQACRAQGAEELVPLRSGLPELMLLLERLLWERLAREPGSR